MHGINNAADINCCTVHRTIQQIDSALHQYRSKISITALADTFHVPADVLAVHISTLYELHYIEFTDRIRENICLTTAGRYTVVPDAP